MSDTDDALTCVGGISIIAVTVIVSSLWSGFVLTKLWGWFIVPVFNAPYLTIPQAIGLTIIITMLWSRSWSDSEDGDKSIELAVKAILAPAFSLLFGWIVSLFL